MTALIPTDPTVPLLAVLLSPLGAAALLALLPAVRLAAKHAACL